MFWMVQLHRTHRRRQRLKQANKVFVHRWHSVTQSAGLAVAAVQLMRQQAAERKAKRSSGNGTAKAEGSGLGQRQMSQPPLQAQAQAQAVQEAQRQGQGQGEMQAGTTVGAVAAPGAGGSPPEVQAGLPPSPFDMPQPAAAGAGSVAGASTVATAGRAWERAAGSAAAAARQVPTQQAEPLQSAATEADGPQAGGASAGCMAACPRACFGAAPSLAIPA